MDIKLIVALISLLGVFLSALVQFYLGRQSEVRKKLIEIRAEAYLDLVNSVSEIAVTSRTGLGDYQEQLKSLNQAKSRAIMLGSTGVVSAIEVFWRKYGSLDSEESMKAFTLIVFAMRKDLSSQGRVAIGTLNSALFGPETRG